MAHNRVCRYCGEEKPLDEFHIALSTTRKTYRRRKCNTCYNDRKKNLRRERREQYWAFKKILSCCECGNQDYRVLEFHHDHSKEINVADALRRGWSFDKIQKEIAKCRVLCANCHRIHHFEEHNRV